MDKDRIDDNRMEGSDCMNVIICDDDELYLNSVTTKVKLWAAQQGLSSAIMCYAFSSSEDVLEEMQRGFQIDAAFLDIQIPGEMSGLALAEEIRKHNEYIPIAFITHYVEYATEGYKVNAIRFLHKPISEAAVFDCMDIIWSRWNALNVHAVVIDTPSQMLRLPVNYILYIEVLGHTCKLVTINAKKIYEFRLTLNKIYSTLPKSIFAQCHRCFIINLMYVRHIKGNIMQMSNDAQIPIGRTYRASFICAYRNHYLQGDSTCESIICTTPAK